MQASTSALASGRSTAVATTEAEVTGTASSTTSTVAFTSEAASTNRVYGLGLAGVLFLGLLMLSL